MLEERSGGGTPSYRRGAMSGKAHATRFDGALRYD
ncbi:hypothetical protein ACVILK_005428 [Bradyrhizobium embrapense]